MTPLSPQSEPDPTTATPRVWSGPLLPEDALPTAPETPSPANILLVDDRAENLLALEAILDDLGQNLVSVTSGEEALRALLKGDFALILMDVQMPGLSGYDTAKLIKDRERTRHIPIIFLTALSKEDCYVFKGYSAGAVDYLFKPFDPSILKAKVQVFVDLHYQNAEIARQARALARHSAELERANHQLREADRYKDEFLSVISHELRTPLNFISGFASILEDEVPGPQNEKQHEYLGKILTGVDRMMHLVDDLLDFAKMQAGKFNLRCEVAPLAPLVDDVLATSADQAQEKDLHLEADIRVERPVRMDAKRIVQVLSNLVTNAMKFTPEGGTIRVSAYESDDTCVVEVSDTGVGIASEDIPRLFTRFQQLDMSSTRPVGGAGLGLSISKAIVQAHGGTIDVRSEPSVGSTFWFTLPLGP